MSAPARSAERTLGKLGAHLRWQIEKAGVDPEAADVVILVDALAEAERLTTAFHEGFDGSVMSRAPTQPSLFVVHGVRIRIGVREKP